MADATISPAPTGTDDFEIGATINQVFTAFSKAPLQLILIAAVPALLSFPANLHQISALFAVFQYRGDPQAMALAMQSGGGAGFIPGLLSFVGSILSIISLAALIFGSSQLMLGEQAQLGGWMRFGLSRFWPIIGVSFLVMLGAGVGFVLLIVPGIILALMWSAAFPICVIEKLGPIKSLGRSAFLTKGHRWSLLGLFILFVVVAWVVYAVLLGVLFAIRSPIAMAIGLLVVTVLGTLVGCLLQASVYQNLRLAKEGVRTGQVAAVFD